MIVYFPHRARPRATSGIVALHRDRRFAFALTAYISAFMQTQTLSQYQQELEVGTALPYGFAVAEAKMLKPVRVRKLP